MILYRYLAKEVFTTMLAVTAIVLVITMGWRFSGYLHEAAAGVISKDILFLLIVYRLPGFLELILPISFFLGIMLAYGRLYIDSEMVVLASCGISPRRLVGVTLVLSLVIMVLTIALTLWLKPSGEARVGALFAEQKNLTEFDTLVPGRFQTLHTGNRVTYAEALTAKDLLANLFINEQQHPGVDDTMITIQAAEGLTQVDTKGQLFLVLKNGTRYTGVPGQKGYRVIAYEEYGQLIEKGPAGNWGRRRQGIPTYELLTEPNQINISELHWRIAVVLMVPIIALMAIPLSRVNPRQGRFSRLLPGMLLCFLYVSALSAGRSALEAGSIPLGMGLWWVHLIYLIIVTGLFYADALGRTWQRLKSGRDYHAAA